MPGCAVATCDNYSRKTKGTDVRYFRFPNNEDLVKQWIIACRRKDDFNLKNSRVCSIHFEEECFEIPLKHRLLEYSPSNYRILRADAVPTINLPGVQQKKRDEGRSLRASKRSTRMEVESILSAASTSQIFQSQEDLECPEQVVGYQHVEEPELDMAVDVKCEVLPHTESETEVASTSQIFQSQEDLECPEQVVGYQHVEEPELDMAVDVKCEVLPHTESETEVASTSQMFQSQEYLECPEQVVGYQHVEEPELDMAVDVKCEVLPHTESETEVASTSQIFQSQEDLECPEQVVGYQHVEEPELDMAVDVKCEVLPHTESETEVSLLKKRIEELEIVNFEQAEKLKNQEATIKQYKDAIAKMFTQAQLEKLFNQE